MPTSPKALSTQYTPKSNMKIQGSGQNGNQSRTANQNGDIDKEILEPYQEQSKGKKKPELKRPSTQNDGPVLNFQIGLSGPPSRISNSKNIYEIFRPFQDSESEVSRRLYSIKGTGQTKVDPAVLTSLINYSRNTQTLRSMTPAIRSRNIKKSFHIKTQEEVDDLKQQQLQSFDLYHRRKAMKDSFRFQQPVPQVLNQQQNDQKNQNGQGNFNQLVLMKNQEFPILSQQREEVDASQKPSSIFKSKRRARSIVDTSRLNFLNKFVVGKKQKQNLNLQDQDTATTNRSQLDSNLGVRDYMNKFDQSRSFHSEFNNLGVNRRFEKSKFSEKFKAVRVKRESIVDGKPVQTTVTQITNFQDLLNKSNFEQENQGSDTVYQLGSKRRSQFDVSFNELPQNTIRETSYNQSDYNNIDEVIKVVDAPQIFSRQEQERGQIVPPFMPLRLSPSSLARTLIVQDTNRTGTGRAQTTSLNTTRLKCNEHRLMRIETPSLDRDSSIVQQIKSTTRQQNKIAALGLKGMHLKVQDLDNVKSQISSRIQQISEQVVTPRIQRLGRKGDQQDMIIRQNAEVIPPLYLKDKFNDVHEFIRYLEVSGDHHSAEMTRRQYNIEESQNQELEVDREELRQIQKQNDRERHQMLQQLYVVLEDEKEIRLKKQDKETQARFERINRGLARILEQDKDRYVKEKVKQALERFWKQRVIFKHFHALFKDHQKKHKSPSKQKEGIDLGPLMALKSHGAQCEQGNGKHQDDDFFQQLIRIIDKRAVKEKIDTQNMQRLLRQLIQEDKEDENFTFLAEELVECQEESVTVKFLTQILNDRKRSQMMPKAGADYPQSAVMLTESQQISPKKDMMQLIKQDLKFQVENPILAAFRSAILYQFEFSKLEKRYRHIKLVPGFLNLFSRPVQALTEHIQTMRNTNRNLPDETVIPSLRTAKNAKALEAIQNLIDKSYYYENELKLGRKELGLITEKTQQEEFEFKQRQLKMQFEIVEEYKSSPKIEELFQKDVEKMKFFQEAKTEEQKNYYPQVENQKTVKYVEKYLKSCEKTNDIPVPHFAQLVGQRLFLTQELVTDGQAQALSELLFQAGEPKQRVLMVGDGVEKVNSFLIQEMVIDDCKISDYGLSLILKALKNQKTLRVLSLQSIDFGQQSMTALNKLLMTQQQDTYMIELSFSNLRLSTPISQQLLSSIYTKCKGLQKLKLSHMNLKDKQQVGFLCQILEGFENLQSLDISWASLTLNSLIVLSQRLYRSPNCLRELNISYNKISECALDLAPIIKKKSEEDSKNFTKNLVFMKYFTEYLKKTEVLNHLNLSGVGFSKAQILELSSVLKNCPALIAIHLSFDATIENDFQFKQQVLDVFGVEKIEQNTIKGSKKYGQFRKAIQKIPTNLVNLHGNQNIQAKNDLMFDLNNKKICKNIAKNHGAVTKGIGRQDDDILGNQPFILTRLLDNFCEAQFTPNEYFDQNKSNKWQLSHRCLVCQKHKYVAISFNSTNHQMNQGLVKIRDPQIIEDLRLVLPDQNYHPNNVPLIFDVNNIVPFKMMHASVFSLLTVGQNPRFQKTPKYGVQMAQAVKELHESGSVLESLNIMKCIKGWSLPLIDKIYHNQLTDVLCVNCPKYFDEDSFSDFIFTEFLHPGFHQKLIYCPQSDSFWMASFLVDLNTKDFYPEFPLVYLSSQPTARSSQMSTVQSQVMDEEKEKLPNFGDSNVLSPQDQQIQN